MTMGGAAADLAGFRQRGPPHDFPERFLARHIQHQRREHDCARVLNPPPPPSFPPQNDSALSLSTLDALMSAVSIGGGEPPVFQPGQVAVALPPPVIRRRSRRVGGSPPKWAPWNGGSALRLGRVAAHDGQR